MDTAEQTLGTRCSINQSGDKKTMCHFHVMKNDFVARNACIYNTFCK